MIITPEEAAYHITDNRVKAIENLVDMTIARSNLHFTRSHVMHDAFPVSWNHKLVPNSLRKVVDHCIERGAYQSFLGSTVGHFAVKLNDTEFLTSRRKTNFNNLSEVGLVKVKAENNDSVIAYGAKPSVGGQSQRIIFKEHPEYDCIVHFHCIKKDTSDVPVRSQREFECGSHECGQNTSDGLGKFGDLSAVMLDKHGPNIVFNKNINPQVVIDFIENNFELGIKTGGFNV